MPEALVERAAKLLQINPNPSNLQVKDIAMLCECSPRTVYRALAAVRKQNDLMTRVTDTTVTSTRKGPKTRKKRTKKKATQNRIQNIRGSPKSFTPPPPASTPAPSIAIPPIAADMPFDHFCKYFSYPHYDGLYRWQYDWHNKVWPADVSLTKVARDHGKSIGHGMTSEWAMSAKGYDILYLGWTSRRKEIADFVYTFFLQRGELIIDKVSSNYHFKTSYGTSFDTFSVKSKEILGMHAMGSQGRQIIEENQYLEDFVRNSDNPLLMIIDDAIDGTFLKEPHKEKDLEDFYLSTIISINPSKLMVVGTKKFKEDFYAFIEKVHMEDIVVYTNTPWLTEDDPRYGKEKDNPCNLLCPERWIHEDDPAYPKYLDLKKKKRQGIPLSSFTDEEKDLFNKLDLMKKKRAITMKNAYWWFAEYMQDPHPITGEVWKKLHYTKKFPGTAVFDMICISIDRATTTNKASDFTGITVTFREKETIYNEVLERSYHNYLVMADYTQKIDIFDLLPFIDKLYREYMLIYQGTLVIKIVVEKQGGGDDFAVMAERAGYKFAHCIILLHTTGNKDLRITDTLRSPINNAQISFITDLEDSELINEIGTYPHNDKIDALDSLCNAFMECEKLPSVLWDTDKLVPILQHHRQDSTQLNLRQLIQQNSRSSIF